MNWVGRWNDVGGVRGRFCFAGCRWIRERRWLYELLGLSRGGVAAISWRGRQDIGERNRRGRVWVMAVNLAEWIKRSLVQKAGGLEDQGRECSRGSIGVLV